MKIKGRVWKFGGRCRYRSDHPRTVPEHHRIRRNWPRTAWRTRIPVLPRKVRPGDIIAAGKNFGCGSSREHAPIAIKAAGVACVIAPSFARIFYRNAINIGLPILECPEAAEIGEGQELEVDLDAGKVRNLTTGASYAAVPFPPFMQELIAAGGLVNYVRKKTGA